MTSPDRIKLAMIKAMLETIDEADDKDAKQAMDLIRSMVGAEKAEK